MPHYAANLEEFESPTRQKPSPKGFIEDKLRQSEANMHDLLAKERALMEDKVA